MTDEEVFCWHEAGHAVIASLYSTQLEWVRVDSLKPYSGGLKGKNILMGSSRNIVSLCGHATERTLFERGLLGAIPEAQFNQESWIRCDIDIDLYFGEQGTPAYIQQGQMNCSEQWTPQAVGDFGGHARAVVQPLVEFFWPHIEGVKDVLLSELQASSGTPAPFYISASTFASHLP